MIETAYLHEYAIADQFMCESYFSEMDIDDNIKQLSAMEAAIASQEYFGESVEGELFVLEAEKKDIFTRIGEAIINLFKAFGETMGRLATEIKENFGKTKKRASSDAYRKAMQDNPEMAQEFLKAVANGSIKAHDVKDLSALIDEATRLSNDLMKGRISEDTFRGKMKKALSSTADTARSITAILGIATAGLTIYRGVTDIRDRVNTASTNDIVDGSMFAESASFSDTINKVMSFFSGHSKFCGDAVNKLNDIQKTAAEQLKTDAGSNNTELLGKYNTLTSELRKVMNVVVKEENSILNLSNKLYGKIA